MTQRSLYWFIAELPVRFTEPVITVLQAPPVWENR